MSKMVFLFCGYGEEPLRVVIFTNVIIFLFAILYFFSGVSFSGNVLVYSSTASMSDNIYTFANSLYFSVVTFTTRGYGDLTPQGISRFFSSC
jgi:voltage-gated potassium channel Kch